MIQNDAAEKEIEADFKKVRQTKGWLCEKGAISDDQIRFYLLLNPRERLNISDMVAAAWRIDLNKYITIVLTFSKYYTNAVRCCFWLQKKFLLTFF